jgi:hypothetical protein
MRQFLTSSLKPAEPQALWKAGKRMSQISMSGLISYDFKSVKSKNRLTYNIQEADPERLTSLTASPHTAGTRPSVRKVRHKTASSVQIKKDFEDALAESYEGVSTEDYLNAFLKQKEQTAMVYGQQQKEYESIKKIAKEVPNLEEAYFMVDKIKELANGTQASKVKDRPRVRPNTE